MTAAISHRGPDGHGTLVRGAVALGHRRLSIIDLQGGQQPMTNEDRSLWLVYNGEIYNFEELRTALRGRGHRFQSQCDTEVILHAYEEWGDGCATRFRGMFAFALADFKLQRVLLARDHFGIKPLYYRCGRGYFAFASELGALRRVADDEPRGCLQSVDYFLRFGYIPAPDTIYADVYKLPAAHTLAVGFDGRKGLPQRYWDLRFAPADEATDQEWEERFEWTVRESVRAHLVADVPFGVFLSGGVDSTLIAMYMQELLQRPVRAFCIGFEEQDYSELQYAQEAAKSLGLTLEWDIVRQSSVEVLSSLIQHYGEPYGDSSAIPTWHVCRLARGSVPMVLSGDGGDENFAGYIKYYLFAKRGLSGLLSFLLRSQSDWPLAVRLLTARGLSGFARPLDAWLALMNYLPDAPRRRLWRPALHHLVDVASPTFECAGYAAPLGDPIAFAQYVDLRTYLPDDILTKVDIASMYHGLEVRTPFIDVEVARLAATLPLSQRLARTTKGGTILKHLPKRVLARRFGAGFVHRRKQGFAIPRDKWFARGGAMRVAFDRHFEEPDGRLRDWFDFATIRRLVRVHDVSGRYSTPLWPLLVLALWLRQNPGIHFEGC